MLEIGAMIALGFNYAALYLVAFIWNWPSSDMELVIHVVAAFCISLLFGVLIVDLKRSLFYTLVAVPLGISLAVAIISMPVMTTTTDIALIDVSITAALILISRLFVVALTFIIMGAIAGCFIGDLVSETSAP
jgi:hypothetical protein